MIPSFSRNVTNFVAESMPRAKEIIAATSRRNEKDENSPVSEKDVIFT
jgi:hypothetical protein